MLCLVGAVAVSATEIMPLPPGTLRTRGSASAVYGKGGVLTVTINRPHSNPEIRLFAPKGEKYWDMSKGKYFAGSPKSPIFAPAIGKLYK